MKHRSTISCLVLAIGLAFYLLKSDDRTGSSVLPEAQPKQNSKKDEQYVKSEKAVPIDETASPVATTSQESDVPLDVESNQVVKDLDHKPLLRAATGGYLGSRMSPLPKGTAALKLKDREVSPSNYGGHYQRVLMEAETSAEIVLHWSGVGADRPIFLHAIHGGRINGESGATLKTNSLGQIVFDFETNAEPGRYEILVRSGHSEEVLHFWVPTGKPELDLYGI